MRLKIDFYAWIHGQFEIEFIRWKLRRFFIISLTRSHIFYSLSLLWIYLCLFVCIRACSNSVSILKSLRNLLHWHSFNLCAHFEYQLSEHECNFSVQIILLLLLFTIVVVGVSLLICCSVSRSFHQQTLQIRQELECNIIEPGQRRKQEKKKFMLITAMIVMCTI